MANQRLINCDFFIKGAFDNSLDNNAKLLYFYLVINADDLGFVGNTDKIIETLDKDNKENALVQYTFDNACQVLIDQGFVYCFVDKHHNRTLLIRHWFLHNKWQKFLSTNFISYRAKVEIVDGCYEMKNPYKGKEINKSNKSNQINKTNKNNNNNDNEDLGNNAYSVTPELDQGDLSVEDMNFLMEESEEEKDPDALPF